MKAVAAAALALLALGGTFGPALAEDHAPIATPAAAEAPVEVQLPRFEPSDDEFSAAFEAFDDPAIEPAPAIDESAATELSGGVASWYGPGFAGRRTASGEKFNPGDYTAAHRSLPFGSRVRVTHNGRSVVVRINDRGPFHGGRVIDLSQAAADEIGIRRAGSGRVELALLES